MKKIFFLFFGLIIFSSTSCGEEILQNITDSFWVAYEKEAGGQTQIFIQQFKNGSWQEALQVTHSLSYNSAPTIAIGKNNEIWVAWSGFDNISTSIYARKYSQGKWSEEYRISIPDEYEDSQPSIDITSDGIPVVVWAGNDGKDDEILFSYFEQNTWSNEEEVNIPNQYPDIDPCIKIVDGKIFVVWSGYRNGYYEIQAAQKDSLLSPSFHNADINLPKQWKKGDSPSIISNDNILLIYSTNGNIYKYVLNRKTLAAENYPERARLSANLENILKQLGLLQIQNITISFITSEKTNQTYKVSSFINKLKPVSTNRKITGILLNKLYIICSFFQAKESYAVTTNVNTAFGDSITYGYKSTGGGYPGRLSAKLGQTVYNRGVGGEKTSDGLNRINSVLQQDDPQRILIMEGTNDMNSGRSISSVIFNLREMVQRSLNYGSKPYLATICPSNRKKTQTEQLNAEIKSLAAEMGVVNPDINAAFGGVVTSQYFFDDIHPNDAGYDVIANTFYNAIVPQSSSSDGGGGCGSIYNISGKGLNINLILIVLLYLYFRRKLVQRRLKST